MYMYSVQYTFHDTSCRTVGIQQWYVIITSCDYKKRDDKEDDSRDDTFNLRYWYRATVQGRH